MSSTEEQNQRISFKKGLIVSKWKVCNSQEIINFFLKTSKKTFVCVCVHIQDVIVNIAEIWSLKVVYVPMADTC